jgi:hypothetical protein
MQGNLEKGRRKNRERRDGGEHTWEHELVDAAMTDAAAQPRPRQRQAAARPGHVEPHRTQRTTSRLPRSPRGAWSICRRASPVTTVTLEAERVEDERAGT